MAVVALVLPPTGAVAQTLEFVGAVFDTDTGVDGLGNAHDVVVGPDGKHVYVASDEDDAVAVLSRDASTGVLTFVEAEFDGVGGVDGLDGAESVAITTDGDHVYVASVLDGAVAVFSRDASTGASSRSSRLTPTRRSA